MGKAILYCYKCSSLLREDDFAKGKAVRVGDHVACAGCAPDAPPEPVVPKRHLTSNRIPAARPGSSQALKRLSEREPPNRKLLVVLGSAVAVLVLIVIVVMWSSGEKPVESSSTPPPPVHPGPRPPADGPDRKALESARAWARANPQDLPGQLREFQNVAFDHERTPSAAEAQKEISRIRTEIRGYVDSALAALEREIRTPLDRGDYRSALTIVENAGKRLPYPDWELARSKREHEIRGLLHNEPPPPKPEEKKPDPQPPPPPPPVGEEAKAWAPRWTQAMARAAGRDHGAAAAELLQAAATLKDQDLRAEAAADVADLKAVQTFLAATMDWIQKRPVGSTFSVQFRDGRTAAGRILQVGPDRIELDAEKESVFAEWSDVAPSWVASTGRDRAEPRLRAIFCLLEGDAEGARSVLGGNTAAVAPRFWDHAPTVTLPKPEAAELAARGLLYAAEREFRSMAARGPAVEKYARLKGEFASTPTVRRALDRIHKRSDAGREYFASAADFLSGGTMKPSREGRIESRADSDPKHTLQNFAELEFYALPSATYRCWILAGGCCQEVFSFLWQGTDLKDPKKAPVEPGGTSAAAVKVAIKGLKPTHAANEPKTPARWEWIEIPLPRHPAPGLKKARFLTDQQGFAIACAVVSSTRSKPPSEAELKDLEKARSAEHPRRAADPDLIGHWTFEEGSGEEVQDLSGNGHAGRLIGTVSRVPGQIGSAIRCDGNGGHVVLPNSPILDSLQKDSYTIVAWYRPEALPAGPAESNDSGHGIVIKRGWHEGLLLSMEARFVMEHWLAANGNGTGGSWQDAYKPGAFYHLAGVVDRAAGRTHLYVDGRLKNSGDWAPGAEAKDYGSEPWRIGIGGPGAQQWAWSAKGLIDDVRLYKRALTAEDVRNLYDVTR